MDDNLRLTLQEEIPDGGSLFIEINSQATVQNLISSYCAKRGIGYNSKLIILDAKKNALSQYNTLQSLGISNGQTLYVGFKKKKGIMDKKWLFGLSIITICIFVLGTIVLTAVYATSGGVVPFVFGIVMDGGSSKTNVLLYKWAGDKHKGTGCVKQEGSWVAEGGIAKQKNVSYVLPQLNSATSKITSPLSETPIYFASTAGMRLLNMSDPQKTADMLDSVSEMLNKTGLSVKAVEIISGKDEGLYAWITTNFLSDTLEKQQKLNPWQPTTVGALDMGGASTQISFAIENGSDPEVEKTTLYGQTHHVFSASFLCFGRDEAENRHRASLVKVPLGTSNVIDPCSPRDFEHNETGERLFNSPCTQNKKFKAWLRDDPFLQGKTFTFKGSGDYEGCVQKMTELLDTKKCKEENFTECFQKINKPLEQQKFVAFATYFYTTNTLNLRKSTLDEYINGTKNYCHLSKDDEKVKKKYGASYCFNACYIYEILISGFSFTNETWSNIQFLSEVDGKDLGWSLGYMIKATNMIPAKNPSPKFTTVGVFTVCIIVFLSLVIAAAAVLAYNVKRERSSNISGYP